MAGVFVIIFLSLFAVCFWILEVVCLMRLPDSEFPGRFDKPLWVGILVFTFVLGALAYGTWRLSVAAQRQAESYPTEGADG